MIAPNYLAVKRTHVVINPYCPSLTHKCRYLLKYQFSCFLNGIWTKDKQDGQTYFSLQIPL